jgi:hypothetical protein
MAEIEQIEEQIRRLSREERAALRRWFMEFEAEAWDAAFEDDVAMGKLDAAADRALLSHRDGQSGAL